MNRVSWLSGLRSLSRSNTSNPRQRYLDPLIGLAWEDGFVSSSHMKKISYCMCSRKFYSNNLTLHMTVSLKNPLAMLRQLFEYHTWSLNNLEGKRNRAEPFIKYNSETEFKDSTRTKRQFLLLKITSVQSLSKTLPTQQPV